MANPNAPHGMQPVYYASGRPYTGGANIYHIPSTDTNAYYIGDIVSTITAGGSDTGGVPNVVRAANGAVTSQQIRGVIMGVQVSPLGMGAGATNAAAVNLNIAYVPATKANDYYVWVADDPDLVFEIQGDNSGTLTLSTSINRNAGYTQAAPGVVNGPFSGTLLTTGSIATTSTLPLRIIQVPYRTNSDNTANTPLYVMVNTHELKSVGTAGG